MWNVKWTPLAEMQLANVLEFWIEHNRSDSYSQKILKEVGNAVSMIADNPYICAEVEQNDVRIRSFLVLKNFSILYRIISEKEIAIVSFWDNRQDPTAIDFL